jgi:hypothetical protein
MRTTTPTPANTRAVNEMNVVGWTGAVRTSEKRDWGETRYDVDAPTAHAKKTTTIPILAPILRMEADPLQPDPPRSSAGWSRTPVTILVLVACFPLSFPQ